MNRLRVSRGRQISFTPEIRMNLKLLEKIPYFKQDYTYWCWAACCKMIFTHYDILVSQCELAESKFENCSCRQNLFNVKICNKPAFLDFKKDHDLDFIKVQEEIDNSRPINIIYKWNGSGRHAVVIVGYYENGDLHIYDPDPSHGSTFSSFEKVLKAYNKGRWETSYHEIRRL
jgi:ABC-type bacteriocin/lantibiotic exporter with double-glycine peptidase domain